MNFDDLLASQPQDVAPSSPREELALVSSLVLLALTMVLVGAVLAFHIITS